MFYIDDLRDGYICPNCHNPGFPSVYKDMCTACANRESPAVTIGYTFVESHYCSDCGTPLAVQRMETAGRFTNTYLEPCPRCAAKRPETRCRHCGALGGFHYPECEFVKTAMTIQRVRIDEE